MPTPIAAVEAYIAAEQYPEALPTAQNKSLSLARSTQTTWTPTTGATGGPWLADWVAMGIVSSGLGETGVDEDGVPHFSAGSSAGSCSFSYTLRNRYLRDTAPATVNVTIT